MHLRGVSAGSLFKLFDRPEARPLFVLTVIALVPRLVAAFFSQGYFAHDDHFLVIEAASSWADGFDYNNWLPWNQGPDPRPTGHSFFYVGLHYLRVDKTVDEADAKAGWQAWRQLLATTYPQRLEAFDNKKCAY